MPYEWGARPTFKSQEAVTRSYTFQKDEWGAFNNFTWKSDAIRSDRIPTDQQFVQMYIDAIKQKGGIVKYLRLHTTKAFAYYGGPDHAWDFYYVQVIIDECYFVGDPFVIDDIVVIVIVIAAVAVAFMFLYPGVIYKLSGVTPSEVIGYNLGQLPLVILLIILIAIGLFAWKGVDYKGKKRRFKIGR